MTLNILDLLNDSINLCAKHLNIFTKPNAFTRKRKLSFPTLIKLMFNMRGNSLNMELSNAFSDPDKRMSASAFEQQKDKLTVKLFEYLFHDFNNRYLQQLKRPYYRLLAIDGSDFDLPWNPKSKYIITRKDKSYCQIHANLIYDLDNHIYLDCKLQPKNSLDEREAALAMLKETDYHNAIVTMDRGYTGFNTIECLNRMLNLYYIIRTKVHGTSSISEIDQLPDKECDRDFDCLVTTSQTYYKQHPGSHLVIQTKKHYHKKYAKDGHWDLDEEHCHIKFRVCKFKIYSEKEGSTWEALITNLDRKEFPLSRIKELYSRRWGIESSFKKLKYDLEAIQFHSKKDKFAEMELYTHLIMYNASSLISQQVKVPRKKRKYSYKINFKMACQLVRKYYWNNGDYQKLKEELKQYLIPIRPGRKYKRKVQPKKAVGLNYRLA